MKKHEKSMPASQQRRVGTMLLFAWVLCVSLPCHGDEPIGSERPMGVERIGRRIQTNRLTKEKLEALELDRGAARAAARKKRMETIVAHQKEVAEKARTAERTRKRRVATLQ
jgi:hypothetical protein